MGKLEFQDLTIDLLSPKSGVVRANGSSPRPTANDLMAYLPSFSKTRPKDGESYTITRPVSEIGKKLKLRCLIQHQPIQSNLLHCGHEFEEVHRFADVTVAAIAIAVDHVFLLL
jgi:hypothetical protein